MVLTLTTEQQQALQEQHDRIVRVRDGDTEYVLVRADLYDQLKCFLDGPIEDLDRSLYEADDQC
jgi:hypothetical protein